VGTAADATLRAISYFASTPRQDLIWLLPARVPIRVVALGDAVSVMCGERTAEWRPDPKRWGRARAGADWKVLLL